jgi:hypothetical protein
VIYEQPGLNDRRQELEQMLKSTQADVMKLASLVRDKVPDQKIMRFIEAYLMMALRGRYRPAAPGDGAATFP